jgi:hypothetical protein
MDTSDKALAAIETEIAQAQVTLRLAEDKRRRLLKQRDAELKAQYRRPTAAERQQQAEREQAEREAAEDAATPNMPPGAFLDRDDNDRLVFSFWIDPNNTAPWRRVRPDDPRRAWAEQQCPNRAERARRQAQNQADQDKYRPGRPITGATQAPNGPDHPLQYDEKGNLILPPVPPRIWN